MVLFIDDIPLQDIKDDSRVVVYGAGKVGEQIVRSILFTGRLQLVAVIDREPSDKMLGFSIPVLSPSEIGRIVYDYIIVAVKDYDLINQIVSTLLLYGVDTNSLVYINKNNVVLESEYNYLKMLERNITVSERKFVLFKAPEHGNTGDYAITLAEKKFFEMFFNGINYITITSDEWLMNSNRIKTIISSNDVLFINGGGYLGDLWGEDESYKNIVESFPNNICFFFPNSFSYYENTFYEKSYFLEDMEWFRTHSNAFVFFRDERSFRLFSKYNDRCGLYPDMVLLMHYNRNDLATNKKYLLCFRNDREKNGNYNDIVKEELKNRAISFDEYDIYIKKFILQQNGDKLVKYVSEKMQQYDLVITDRLHGMLISVVSDVPCIAFDNSTKKISGVYRWIADKDYAQLLSSDEAYKICDCAKKLIQKRKNTEDFKPFIEEFQKMAKQIKTVIGGAAD